MSRDQQNQDVDPLGGSANVSGNHHARNSQAEVNPQIEADSRIRISGIMYKGCKGRSQYEQGFKHGFYCGVTVAVVVIVLFYIFRGGEEKSIAKVLS